MTLEKTKFYFFRNELLLTHGISGCLPTFHRTWFLFHIKIYMMYTKIYFKTFSALMTVQKVSESKSKHAFNLPYIPVFCWICMYEKNKRRRVVLWTIKTYQFAKTTTYRSIKRSLINYIRGAYTTINTHSTIKHYYIICKCYYKQTWTRGVSLFEMSIYKMYALEFRAIRLYYIPTDRRMYWFHSNMIFPIYLCVNISTEVGNIY